MKLIGYLHKISIFATTIFPALAIMPWTAWSASRPNIILILRDDQDLRSIDGSMGIPATGNNPPKTDSESRKAHQTPRQTDVDDEC